MSSPLPSRRRFVRKSMPAAMAVVFPTQSMADPSARGPVRASHFNGVSPADLPAPSAELHLANRLMYGPRPGDLERIASMGAEAFIEEQLHPESIDDSAVEEYVHKTYKRLRKSSKKLIIREQWKQGRELQYSTIYRALFSKRQLFERMVDFWSDHFSIYLWDDWPLYTKHIDDQEVIRPHAMGTFGDLLRASTKSPAMLTYLDNETNTRWGPNENYARELLELHTLGVDNGYTQEDVEELSRALTGWGIEYRRSSVGEFQFYPSLHDRKRKTVLGVELPKGASMADGEKIIDILAEHPNTAGFIAEKLVRRFVSDVPPKRLIRRVKKTFLKTGGDIRAMLERIFDSKEFAESAGQKFKRPADFLYSSLRITAPNMREKHRDEALWWALRQMGHAPFEWVPPNGYPDVGLAWANTNGMLNRWNFSSHIANGYYWGVDDFLEDALESFGELTAAEYVDAFSHQYLGRELRPADRDAMVDYFSAGNGAGAQLQGWPLRQSAVGLVTLLLASPYFQFR